MNERYFRFQTSIALTTTLIAALASVTALAADPPKPWGPVPSQGQLAYHKEELGAFIHFGMNTFTSKEWGNGKEMPSQFTLNPSSLDTDQWVSVIKDAGFKRIVFVAKHHDGFCNWYSGLTRHSVKYANPANQVDVLERLSKSCTAANLNMGVYLSPWDANTPHYGLNQLGATEIDPWRYNEYYIGQLKEILDPSVKKYGNDGKFVEVWMDGARGTGYYQPYFFSKEFLSDAKGFKEADPKFAISKNLGYLDRIDMSALRDDQTWFGVIKGFNPEMVIFSPVGSELRWPATESGRLLVPLWSKVKPVVQRANYLANEESESGTTLNYIATGDPDGTRWSIAEADTSILASGWFENNKSDTTNNKQVKTLRQLGDIYFESVGRGGVLLLNFAPNTNGVLSDNQVNRTKEFGDAIKNTFAVNLAGKAMVTALHHRGDHDSFSPSNVLDGNYDTYWTMDDDRATGEITIDLGEDKTFDVVSIQEYIPLGQRVSRFKVEVYADGWKQYGQPSLQRTIGYKALIRGGIVTASQVRLTVLESQAVPVINSIGLYKTASRDFEIGTSFVPEYVPGQHMKMIDDQSTDIKDTQFYYFKDGNREVSTDVGTVDFVVCRRGKIDVE
jgi:alpha-L-fucosidase